MLNKSLNIKLVYFSIIQCMEKYSIWIEPGGKIKENLSTIIKQLSEKFGTPIFTPHVTLLGGFEGEEDGTLNNMAQLQDIVRPYVINLTGKIKCEDVWSRAIIDLIEKNDTVIQAFEIARKIFDIQTTSYVPHASLMYTRSISVSMEERLKAASKLDARLLKGRFVATSFILYRTNEEAESESGRWIKVKQFQLNSS